MSNSRIRDIKQAQKESLLLREISQYMQQISIDDAELADVYVSRVKLSPDKSRCTIFFACHDGPEVFGKKLGKLILYKPSLRTALAKSLSSRYVPELLFKYDDQVAKQHRMEELFRQIEDEDKS